MIDEMAECTKETTPKARKTHKCCECRGFIEKGEVYHKCTGIWSGEPITYKTCSDCEKMISEIDKGISDRWEKLAFGELSEAVSQSEDLEMVKRFIANMESRKVKVREYWYKLKNRLMEKDEK